jgi:protein O-mannosyl-transferase
MRIRYQIMLLSIAVLGVYYPALHAPLSSVDDPGMYDFLLNSGPFTLREIFFPGGSTGYYRPLLLVSFLFDKYVWGLEESFMHLDNIVFHLGNSLLVFALARRVCRINNWSCGGAFVAALLFAVHPINAESVNWISGRTDPLAAGFLLLSVLALLYRERPVASSLAAALCMLLACLVKESAIFYLPAALVFPFYLPAENDQAASPRGTLLRNLPHFACFLLAGAGYFLLRSLAFSTKDKALAQVATSLTGAQRPDSLLRLRMLLKAVGFYAKKLVEPFPLNFGIVHVSDAYIPLGLLVLAGLGYLLLRRTLLSFCVICAASIASSAILIAFLNQTWTPLAERYMYIPSAFLLVGVCLFLQQTQTLRSRRAYLVAATGLIAGIAVYGTFTRSLLWQDNLAFFQDTTRKSPGFMPARNELAGALKRAGKTKEAHEIYQSFEMQAGLKNVQVGMINKAGGYLDRGDYAAARALLREVLKTPGEQEVNILEKLLQVNKLEVSQGKTTDAAVYDDNANWLTRLYDLSRNPFYQYRLGILNLHQKHDAKALAAFNEVCRSAPQDIYYRKPSEKLASTLQARLGNTAPGGIRNQ